MVGIWTSDNQIGAESSSGETWGALDFRHLAFDIADTGKIDQVEGVLLRLV